MCQEIVVVRLAGCVAIASSTVDLGDVESDVRSDIGSETTHSLPKLPCPVPCPSLRVQSSFDTQSPCSSKRLFLHNVHVMDPLLVAREWQV